MTGTKEPTITCSAGTDRNYVRDWKPRNDRSLKCRGVIHANFLPWALANFWPSSINWLWANFTIGRQLALATECQSAEFQRKVICTQTLSDRLMVAGNTHLFVSGLPSYLLHISVSSNVSWWFFHFIVCSQKLSVLLKFCLSAFICADSPVYDTFIVCFCVISSISPPQYSRKWLKRRYVELVLFDTSSITHTFTQAHKGYIPSKVISCQLNLAHKEDASFMMAAETLKACYKSFLSSPSNRLGAALAKLFTA